MKNIDILTDVKPWSIFPWAYEDNSVDEISCTGVFEYVPGDLRGKFMDEVFRILVPNGKAAFAVAYWNTARAIQDFRYAWPPLCEQSFLYFNKGWRDANKLDLDLKCDFDFTYGYTCEPQTAARNEESRSFYIKHYTNTVDFLHVLFTKRPPPELTEQPAEPCP